jgi:hypothetical protein
MSTDERIRNDRNYRRSMILMGGIMTLFYLTLGSLLLLRIVILPADLIQFQNIFAALLLIYGGYRGYRLYIDHIQ